MQASPTLFQAPVRPYFDCILDQIKSFLRELEFFIDMTDVEQETSMGEELPTVEEYQKRRMGSSAVGVCLALTEYAGAYSEQDDALIQCRYSYEMEIPRAAMEDENMKQLWDETNLIISM